MVFRHRRRGDVHGQSDGGARCAEDGVPRAESARTGGPVDLQVRRHSRDCDLHSHRGTTVGVDFVLCSSCAVKRGRPWIE